MIKGTQLKNVIIQKILETFPGSFTYNDGKEVRINGTENGEVVQVKVTLTCAKVPVESDAATAVNTDSDSSTKINFEDKSVSNEKIPDEPSEDEKARLKKLLENLGL